jgi:hypothetical protein
VGKGDYWMAKNLINPEETRQQKEDFENGQVTF